MNDHFIFVLLLTIVQTFDGYTAQISPNQSKDLSDFERATKSRNFVDKTILLKKFIVHGSHQIITFPKGFGKSTNFDMARRFFQIPIDDKTGEKIDRKTSHYYQLFTNKSLNLEIARDENFIEESFGKYPVLHFNFSNVNVSSTGEIIDSMINEIALAVQEYEWLYNKLIKSYDNSTSNGPISHWATVFNKKTIWTSYTPSLRHVVLDIKHHFNQSILLLIAGYDVPYMQAIYDVLTPIDDFYKSLIEIFVTDTIARPVLISGVTRLFVRRMLTHEINSFIAHYFLDYNPFGDYKFGFTEPEVHRLLAVNNVDKAEWGIIKQHFNGYRVKTTSSNSSTPQLPFYNPKAVLQYLETRTYQSHQLIDDIIPKIMRCLSHTRFFQTIFRVLMKHTNTLDYDFYPWESDADDLIFIAKKNCSDLPDLTRYTAPFLENGYLTFQNDGTYTLANSLMENKLRYEVGKYFLDICKINVTNPHVTAALHSIMNSNLTTDKMLLDFRKALELSLQHKRSFSPFEFLSYISGFLYSNWNFTKNNVKMSFRNVKIEIIPRAADTIFIPNYDRNIVVVFVLGYNRKIPETLYKARKFIPLEPRNVSNIHLIKYIAIVINKKWEMEIERDESREW